jgi:hypothetical protein
LYSINGLRAFAQEETPMRIFLPAALAAALIAAPAYAEALKGTVTSINEADKSLQLTTTNREAQTIDVVIVHYGSAEGSEGVQVGDKLTIEGEKKDGLHWEARRIEGAGSSPAAAPHETAPEAPPAPEPAAAAEANGTQQTHMGGRLIEPADDTAETAAEAQLSAAESAPASPPVTGSTGAAGGAEAAAAQKGDPAVE